MKRWAILGGADEDNGFGREWHLTEAPNEEEAVRNVFGADRGGYVEPYVLVFQITDDPTVVAGKVSWEAAGDATVKWDKVTV